MYSDSRKAQHSGFAHHRAMLVFTNRLVEKGGRKATVREGTGPIELQRLRERVSAGILGFVPTPPTGGL